MLSLVMSVQRSLTWPSMVFLAWRSYPGRAEMFGCRRGSGVVGTSPSAICMAEHRVEFRVEPDLADFLRATAGHGDLGSPFQRLLA